MDKVVLDTSVIVKWFSQERGHQKAIAILDQLVEGRTKLVEPELIFYELINAFWFGRKFTTKKISRIIEEFTNLEPEIVLLRSNKLGLLRSNKLGLFKPNLIEAILVLIKRCPITAYDASFIAIAEEYQIPLVTADTQHHKKTFSKFIVSLNEFI